MYAGLALYPLFTNGQRHEPRSGWIRGARCVTMALISITYLTLMSGSLDHTRDLFSHFLTPILVLIDWLLVGRDIYEFLNPREGTFFGRIMEFLLGELLFAYVVWMLAQARRMSVQQPPYPPQQYGQYPGGRPQQPGYYR